MSGSSALWRDRPVLVTGALGLLGGHVVAELLARGARVVTFVRDLVPDSYLLREGLASRVVQIRGDFADLRDCERALEDYEVRTLLHLGAQAIVATARRSPWETFESNVRGTWNLLEAARRASLLDSIVVASSDKAYGATDRLPYTEAHPLLGGGPYEASKAMADLCAQSYAASYRLPLAILRCGNLYGPGDLHFDRLIPEMLRARLRGARPVLRSTGRASRDWLWVGDAVAAYLGAAERLAEGEDAVAAPLRGQAFNVSTGRPRTVLEVARAVDDALGVHEPSHEILGRAEDEGEIPAQTLDCRRAREVLGWEATVGLEEGLRRTLPWYRDYFAEAG